MGRSVCFAACVSWALLLSAAWAGAPIDADPATFDNVINGVPGMVSLVGFFAPWCGHCKSLKPTWERLGELYADEPGVQIVSVDADAHRSLGEKHGVQGFPTLKIFTAGTPEPEEYQGGRKLEDFLAILNERADTDVSPDGKASSKVGLIPDVHSVLNGFTAASAEEQARMLEEAKELVGEDEGKKVQWALYAKIAAKIMTEGAEYVSREASRLSSMLSNSGSSITMAQRKLFETKMNVLNAFDEL